MPTAEDALLQYEGGQNAVAMSALTDSGDRTTYTSSESIWSRATGFTPVVRPNGILTGGTVSVAASGSDDVVDIAALTCNLNGVETSVNASADFAITRPATAVAKVCSITVNSSGVLTEVAGTDGGSTTFSETRGAAGGPPYIPVDSIEIAQVRMTSDTSAAIASSEIKATVGLHRELANNPQYTISYKTGRVTFSGALPAIHTGDEGKGVYASYAGPIFASFVDVTDFQPPEETHQVNSTQVYGRTIGSSSTSLGQGSFVAYVENGVTDTIVQLKNENLWFKFFPDQYASPYILVQGKMGISRSFPPGDNIRVDATLSADEAATEYAS